MDLIYRYDPVESLERARIDGADAAREALCQGNERFTEIVRRMQLRAKGEDAGEPLVVRVSPASLGFPLTPGEAPAQMPFALVLGCSDARVPIEAVFDQSFNDLFVIRVAGNVPGTECLGSLDYAARHLKSLRLVVVLGHSGCGAVTAAVDAYLSPDSFADIAFTFPLRSLVDRIQLAVGAAAKSLVAGGHEHSPGYREALIETAVYLNAAVTAYDLRREVQSLGASGLEVVYGVYDLSALRVRALPDGRHVPTPESPCFADAPQTAGDLADLGRRLAERLVGGGDA